ncbi:MAG: four-carbon acid sugar kinase family protein [Gammaproteobacteria bacterium]|nr:four-carbon acid sugar kinase family protein [Gammaproteobacteria bacterium]
MNKENRDKPVDLAAEPIALEQLYTKVRLPDQWPENDLLEKIRGQLDELNAYVCVLDDDPTGTQTVHNVAVTTEWSYEQMRAVYLKSKELKTNVIYISTNSRNGNAEIAENISYQISSGIEKLAQSEKFFPIIVSRSDSTLRGHLVAETRGIMQGSSVDYDAIIFAPFFEEGGRITLGINQNIIHWVIQSKNGREIAYPAVLTDYARDTDFGYDSLFLADYLIEKHAKQSQVLKRQDILVITIDEIRKQGYEHIAQRLADMQGQKFVIVSAVTYRDLEVFTLAMLNSMLHNGKRFLVRSAASIVRTLGGIESRTLLSVDDIYPQRPSRNNGLVIVGSYVKLTQLQFEHTRRTLDDLVNVELDVKNVLNDDLRRQTELKAIKAIDEAFNNNKDVLFFTSRQQVVSDKGQIAVGQIVSNSVINIMRQLKNAPGWVVAKGGITSYNVAKKGLNLKQALVKGQIKNGIPVWAADSGAILIIVPGNVGEEDTLTQIIRELKKPKANEV